MYKDIDGYKVLTRLTTATREIYLVTDKSGNPLVMKTLTKRRKEENNDIWLARDVQDQIEREIVRWDACKDLGILNPIVNHGRDNDKCSTCYLTFPYVKYIMEDNLELYKRRRKEINKLTIQVYKRIEESNLWIDNITFDELIKPSSWGVTEKGKLVLIDYGI